MAIRKTHKTMKTIYATLCLLLCAPVMSQSLPVNDEGMVVYEAVGDAPGTDRELYDRCLAWFGEHFTNARVVIKEKDEEMLKITAKPKFMLQVKEKKGVNTDVGFIIYDFKLWFRDGKYRYKIDYIHLEYIKYYGIEEWMKPDHEDSANNPQKLTNIDKYFQELIGSLHQGMQPKVKKKSEDEW